MGSHRVPKGVREKGSPRLERGFKCVEGRKRKIAKSGVSSRCYRIPVDWVLARIVEGGQGIICKEYDAQQLQSRETRRNAMV